MDASKVVGGNLVPNPIDMGPATDNVFLIYMEQDFGGTALRSTL